MSGPDRALALRDDIAGEPAALARLLDAWERPDGPAATLERALSGRDRPPLLLVGLGSSRYAALTAAARIVAVGGEALVELASTPTPALPDPRRPLLAISASGRTDEVVAAADRHRGVAPVIAITDRPDSRLVAAADAALPLFAGPERSGVACRTHLATLATLLLVGASVTQTGPTIGELRPAVAAIEALIGSAGDWLPAAVELLDGASTIHVVGSASRPGAAEQAALMLREGPRLPATAWDAGDWPHVGVYTFLPGATMLLFAGTAYDRRLVDTARSRSGDVVAIGRVVDSATWTVPLPGADDPVVRSLVEVTAGELLAAELWSRIGQLLPVGPDPAVGPG